MDNDDDMPVLSDTALLALQEFYAERAAHEERFNRLENETETTSAKAQAGESPINFLDHELNMDIFSENWQYSQFWYTEETARILVTALLGDASKGETIAMKESARPKTSWPKILLFEFDRRFKIFKDEFVFYDFKNPFQLPSELKGTVNHFICDPPFLSDDCQTKVALSVKWLSKSCDVSPDSRAKESRLVICTGERMERTIAKLYQKQGVFRTSFEPVHSKQQLSNEFRCFANFECSQWFWK
ncbi:Protein-lysine N-methyltransferase EFM5 [Erysiphe neolycopersici]|uniref:Protein-lysine N-methyltransferase EFM5 n=1 Tax=Erysiphe neolycopersici TaxID=212602 RepID=A0A420HVH9_9PEZI|nr:Protein-lysine N-methyltransferase EFM5 [Erysiphe neolycopersici]